mgnify:FL=1
MKHPAQTIAYRVQHTVERAEALQRLLPLLPKHTEVIVDHGEVANPCRGYLLCLKDPPETTHLCVIQDDALPCKGFAAELEKAVAEKPDEVISLFVGGLPGRTRKDFLAALGDGQRWSPVYFREVHHVVAVVWPVSLIHEFLAWYEGARIPGPIPPRSDDAVVGYWARTRRKLFWATVPCLVEHPDDFPSTIRNQSRFGDKGRRAIAFLDDVR